LALGLNMTHARTRDSFEPGEFKSSLKPGRPHFGTWNNAGRALVCLRVSTVY
jgi:hypothetical protein